MSEVSEMSQESLKENQLYIVREGNLVELKTDPEDLKKVKITEDALASVFALQKSLRQKLGGYKPDVTLVCSALLQHATQQEEAMSVVVHYWKNMADKLIHA